MKSLYIFFLLVAVLMTAGCTSGNQNSTITPAQQTVTTIVSAIPTTAPLIVTTLPPTTPLTTVPITIVNTTTPVLMYTTNVLPPGNDPYINNFNFQMSDVSVSDCVMKQIFPDIANNPNYGPNANPPYLVGLSKTQVNAYIADYKSGKNVGQSGSITFENCENIPVTQSNIWHFEEVYAKFTPRNAKPSLYMVILSVHSTGKVVSQITANQTLTMDQPVEINSLIPLKGTDTVNTVSLNFNRLTGN